MFYDADGERVQTVVSPVDYGIINRALLQRFERSVEGSKKTRYRKQVKFAKILNMKIS